MSNALQIVKQEAVLGKDFKVYGDFENPLFLAKDVAEWIEYSKTSEGFYNVSKMLMAVDDDEKVTITISNSEGKSHNQAFLTENGLYEILMLSRKPIAKQFKKEVKRILHEIRTKGNYKVPHSFREALLLAAEQQAKIEALENDKKKLTQTNSILTHSKKTYTASEIAKELGFKSAIEFNKDLERKGIQYKRNGTWLPTSYYADKGYYDIKQEVLENGMVVYNSHFTQKGREFILNIYKKELELF